MTFSTVRELQVHCDHFHRSGIVELFNCALNQSSLPQSLSVSTASDSFNPVNLISNALFQQEHRRPRRLFSQEAVREVRNENGTTERTQLQVHVYIHLLHQPVCRSSIYSQYTMVSGEKSPKNVCLR